MQISPIYTPSNDQPISYQKEDETVSDDDLNITMEESNEQIPEEDEMMELLRQRYAKMNKKPVVTTTPGGNIQYHTYVPPYSSPTQPIQITIQRQIQKEPQASDDEEDVVKIGEQNLPYLNIEVGVKPYKGLDLISLKDSGSSHTLIQKTTYETDPIYRNAPLIPCYTKMQTADNQENLSCESYTELWLTLTSTTQKKITFKHPVYVVSGLSEEFFLGHDILGSERKVFETPSILALAQNLAIKNKFKVIDDDANVFHIPIFTKDIRRSPTILINQVIHLPPKSSNIFTQPTKPGVTYVDDYYDNEYETIGAIVEQVDEDTIRIAAYNNTDVHQQLEINDRLIPNGRYARLNLSSMVRQRIMTDEYYTPEEKEEQVQKFEKEGECALTASQYIDDNSRLTIFETPPEVRDLTEDELVRDLPLDHLTPEIQAKVRNAFRRHAIVLAKNPYDIHHNTVVTATIELKNDGKTIMNSKYQAIPEGMMKAADEMIAFFIKTGILEPGDDGPPFISNILFQKKEKQVGQLRALLDSRILNFNTKKVECSIASHAQIMSVISGKRWITTIDISQAYFAIPIEKSCRKFTTFYTHRRDRLQFTSCPQGWINSAFYLDLLLNKILGDIRGVAFVADDILIASDGTQEEHIELIEKVLERLEQANLRAKHTKVSVMKDHTEFLGVIYNHGTMSIPDVRSQGYQAIAPPNTPKPMKSFLASLNYYKRWIPRHSELIRPLHLMSLQPKGTKLKWTEVEIKAFADLKEAIKNAVALHLPQPGRQFVCYSDASAYAISFVVEQICAKKIRYPISFVSKMLSKSEAFYSIPKKEGMALLYGITAMDFWFAFEENVVIYTDALSLTWLRNCRGRNPFLTRVAVQISAYNVELRHIAGKDNQVADLLSRNTKDDQTNPHTKKLKQFLSEKDSLAIIKRLTIPNGTVFTVAEVHELLTGESMPAAPELKKKRPIRKVRETPVSTTKTRLPTTKTTRKIKMPYVTQYHPFYPNQRKDLIEAQKKKKIAKTQVNTAHMRNQKPTLKEVDSEATDTEEEFDQISSLSTRMRIMGQAGHNGQNYYLEDRSKAAMSTMDYGHGTINQLGHSRMSKIDGPYYGRQNSTATRPNHLKVNVIRLQADVHQEQGTYLQSQEQGRRGSTIMVKEERGQSDVEDRMKRLRQTNLELRERYNPFRSSKEITKEPDETDYFSPNEMDGIRVGSIDETDYYSPNELDGIRVAPAPVKKEHPRAERTKRT